MFKFIETLDKFQEEEKIQPEVKMNDNDNPDHIIQEELKIIEINLVEKQNKQNNLENHKKVNVDDFATEFELDDLEQLETDHNISDTKEEYDRKDCKTNINKDVINDEDADKGKCRHF